MPLQDVGRGSCTSALSWRSSPASTYTPQNLHTQITAATAQRELIKKLQSVLTSTLERRVALTVPFTSVVWFCYALPFNFTCRLRSLREVPDT